MMKHGEVVVHEGNLKYPSTALREALSVKLREAIICRATESSVAISNIDVSLTQRNGEENASIQIKITNPTEKNNEFLSALMQKLPIGSNIYISLNENHEKNIATLIIKGKNDTITLSQLFGLLKENLGINLSYSAILKAAERWTIRDVSTASGTLPAR